MLAALLNRAVVRWGTEGDLVPPPPIIRRFRIENRKRNRNLHITIRPPGFKNTTTALLLNRQLRVFESVIKRVAQKKILLVMLKD